MGADGTAPPDDGELNDTERLGELDAEKEKGDEALTWSDEKVEDPRKESSAAEPKIPLFEEGKLDLPSLPAASTKATLEPSGGR